MAAYRSAGFNLSGNGEPERLHGEMISAGFFEILGREPDHGPTSPDEDRLGANPTVMITEGLWKRKFGSRKDIIGQRIFWTTSGGPSWACAHPAFICHTEFPARTRALTSIIPVGEYNEPKFYVIGVQAGGWTPLAGSSRASLLQQAREDMDRVSRELAAAYPDIDSERKPTSFL